MIRSNLSPMLRRALTERMTPGHKQILEVFVKTGVPKDIILEIAEATVGIESLDYWMVLAFLENLP